MVSHFLFLSFEKTEKITFENRAIFMRRVVGASCEVVCIKSDAKMRAGVVGRKIGG